MTDRPSSESAGTGSTSVSAPGAHARSRNWPCASRTTTTACTPLVGRPASLITCPAVVPAGTFTLDGGAAAGAADTGVSSMGRMVLQHGVASVRLLRTPPDGADERCSVRSVLSVLSGPRNGTGYGRPMLVRRSGGFIAIPALGTLRACPGRVWAVPKFVR